MGILYQMKPNKSMASLIYDTPAVVLPFRKLSRHEVLLTESIKIAKAKQDQNSYYEET